MSTERLVFVRKASGLVRELTALDVVIWGIAAPTASGLMYYMVTTVNDYPGSNPILSFLIGGLICLPIFACLAYLSRIMPRAGGPYVAISRLVDPSVAYLMMMINAIGWSMTVGVMTWVGTGILGSGLQLAGLATKGAGIIAAGDWVSGTTGRLIISCLLMVVFWLAALRSLRAVKVLMQVAFWLPLVATLILVFAGYFTRDVAGAWNNTWGAGEVKSPAKTLFNGIILGVIGTIVLYVIVASAVVIPFAKSGFISAYAYLANGYPDALKAIMPVSSLSLPLFLGSLLPSPWLAVLSMVLICLWFYNTAIPSLVAATRVWFAMSFDRQLPKTFAAVNKRGVPTTSTHLASLFALAAVFFELLGVRVLLGMMDVMAFTFWWATGLAALMLPYRRPDVYMLSPAQGKFLGLPVITWLGAITTGIGWFFIGFSIKWFSDIVLTLFGVLVFLIMMLYVWQQEKNAREGIDMTTIYGQIPPE